MANRLQARRSQARKRTFCRLLLPFNAPFGIPALVKGLQLAVHCFILGQQFAVVISQAVSLGHVAPGFGLGDEISALVQAGDESVAAGGECR